MPDPPRAAVSVWFSDEQERTSRNTSSGPGDDQLRASSESHAGLLSSEDVLRQAASALMHKLFTSGVTVVPNVLSQHIFRR